MTEQHEGTSCSNSGKKGWCMDDRKKSMLLLFAKVETNKVSEVLK